MDYQGVPELLARPLQVWKNTQVLLPKVVRWSRFVERQKTRRQDNLQHSHSVTDFAITVVTALQQYNESLDGFLITAAFSVHDYPEGILEQDTAYNLKSDEQDLREYAAFISHYYDHPVFEFWHKAYLLQFSDKPRPNFPKPAQDCMEGLKALYFDEINTFAAIEHLDYLLYAIEHRLEASNRDLMAVIAHGHTPRLDQLAAVLPGLKETFWSPEIRAWCHTMAEGGNADNPK